MKIGLLTGGGDCPGLNAVIRAVVRKGTNYYGDSFIGFLEGWRGVLEDKTMTLDLAAVNGILPIGGTILRTSRTNATKQPDGLARIEATFKKNGLDALIAIGGDDTLGVAKKLNDSGVKVVGCPKTIDNDLAGTDFTFGFDTAVGIATECIDRLHTTAESHNRVIVVEVMGRDAGWIAMYAGIAGSADVILIPERPIDIEAVCNTIRKQHDTGKLYSIVVVAEGAKVAAGAAGESNVLAAGGVDEFGHARLGGIGTLLSTEIEKRTGYETRSAILGHVQRGGTPSAFDRVLGTRYGVGAIDLVHEGKFGQMVSLKGNKITSIPLAEAVASNRRVDQDLMSVAEGILDKPAGK
jgi:6-phosphofructokinase 1